MATYKIEKMRAIRPTEKMSEKHPDRFLTIHGKFFNEKNERMSITQKVVTYTDAKHPEFLIDIKKGILTLHEGQRGRRAVEGISQEDINSILNDVRNAK